MRQPEIVYCTFDLQSYQLNIDLGTSSVQRFLLVFLSIVISGSNSVIKQLVLCRSRYEVEWTKKAISTAAYDFSRYCFLWSIKPHIDFYTGL